MDTINGEWGQHHLLPGRLMCCNELPVACHWSLPSSANQRPQLSSSDQSEARRVMTSRLPIITHIRRDSPLLIKGISCRPPLLFATARYIKTLWCNHWMWMGSIFPKYFLSMSAVNLNSNLERFGGKLFSSKWVFNIFWELWRRGGDSTKEMSTQNSTNMKLLETKSQK